MNKKDGGEVTIFLTDGITTTRTDVFRASRSGGNYLPPGNPHSHLLPSSTIK